MQEPTVIIITVVDDDAEVQVTASSVKRALVSYGLISENDIVEEAL